MTKKEWGTTRWKGMKKTEWERKDERKRMERNARVRAIDNKLMRNDERERTNGTDEMGQEKKTRNNEW